MPRSIELERRRSKERRDEKSGIYKVWKEEYNCEKGVRKKKKRILYPECRVGRKRE